jgi:hypothetical protein
LSHLNSSWTPFGMIYAPPRASDAKLFAIARDWIDLAANDRYEKAFDLFSYRMAPLRPELSGADCLREDIARYRSAGIFPGESSFRVTDWRTATGGNPQPLQRVTWYKPNDLNIACVVSVELPLNGKWSDLLADFLLYGPEPGLGHRVELEDLSGGDDDAGDDA